MTSSQQQCFKIAVIPGDGIGKEVMPEGMRVLEAAAERFSLNLEFRHIDWPSSDYSDALMLEFLGGDPVIEDGDRIYAHTM